MEHPRYVKPCAVEIVFANVRSEQDEIGVLVRVGRRC